MQEFSFLGCPPPRTLQRWLKEAGLNPAPSAPRPVNPDRACEPHLVWQMDAVEGLKLLDGSFASWLRISDEFTGAILGTWIFAAQRWSVVPAVQTQKALQEAFARWGRPPMIRVDNGIPWGHSAGWPTAISLWLAGLSVRLWWNQPYRPQQNGVVERTQGVSQNWVNPEQCANLEELRTRVANEDRVQREVYPSINGQSRRDAYPDLCHSGRGYVMGCESWLWELNPALEFLAEFAMQRKVSKRGQISAYHRLLQVGSAYGGRMVGLQLDASSQEWVIRDETRSEIRRWPANELSSEAIRSLKVSKD
jgi:hypothetical protein